MTPRRPPPRQRRHGLRQGVDQSRQFVIHRHAEGLEDARRGVNAGRPGGARDGLSDEVGQVARACDG